MSSVYVLEPPTKGKVLLKTTYGPLDIELWPKEAPKSVRNFVQLCLEGYYDNTIFHRIIKSFLIQGGDPTGSGAGGESIYGGGFPDEFHSRLRFNHRGLVACANAGSPHTNGSQFFISLDRCDWLDKKNSIFGKVTGDSIYNLLRIGDVETDKNDRPLDPPPKIISVEVLWNPFDDIITRVPRKSSSSSKADTSSKDEKTKVTKKLNLLSFGDEAEEDEKELVSVKERIKSSHDVLNDPRLLKEAPKTEQDSSEINTNKDLQLTVRAALTKKDNVEREFKGNHFDDDDDDDNDDNDDTEALFDARMRQRILKKRRELGEQSNLSTDKHNLKEHKVSPPRSDIEGKGNKLEKLSLKKKGIGSEARAERIAKADADLQLLGQAEQDRQMQKQKKRRLQGREGETLTKLERLKKSLSSKATHEVPFTKENEESEAGWWSHRLKFTPDLSNKDDMARKDDPNEYVVQDPLLEKGKEKFNRMQAKLKRREREWAGKSIT